MEQAQKGRQDFTTPTKKGRQIFHWSKSQQVYFIWFLLLNLHDIYQTSSNRVKKRFFKLMSQFIPTRTPAQCRTHFSRLIKEKIQNGDVKIYLTKKMFNCFCCQKENSLNLQKSIQNYLQVKNIENQIFKINIRKINQNIQELYQLGKSRTNNQGHNEPFILKMQNKQSSSPTINQASQDSDRFQLNQKQRKNKQNGDIFSEFFNQNMIYFDD